MASDPDEEPRKSRSSSRAFGWRALMTTVLRDVAVAFLSVWLVWVVGANIFLSTTLFHTAIDGDPDTIWIGFERGYTFFPGRIHAHKLNIRAKDSNVEWILRIDDVRFDVAVNDLFAWRFDVWNVKGSGVSMRLRQRPNEPLDDVAKSELPPVPGFGEVEMKPAGPPHPEQWDDSRWRLWTVNLEDVDAEHTREIWIDRERFVGDAHIRGGFFLKPIRKVGIGPVATDIDHGQVLRGDKVIVEAVRGFVGFTLERVDPRNLPGPATLRAVSFRTDLEAHVDDVDRLPREEPAFRVHGALDVHRLAVGADHGVIRRGSHADIAMPAATLVAADVQVTSAVHLDLDVTDRLRFSVETSNLEGHRLSDQAYLGAIELAAMSGIAHDLDLANLLPDLRLRVEVPDADVPNLAVWDHDIPKDTPFHLGGGHAHASATLLLFPKESRATGEGVVRVDGLDMHLAKMRVRAGTRAAKSAAPREAWAHERGGDLSGTTVEASFGNYFWKDHRAEDVALDLRIAKATFAGPKAPEAPLAKVSNANLSARVARLDTGDPLRQGSTTVEVEDASIVDSHLFAAYLPKGTELRLLDGHAHFAISSALTVDDHKGSGMLSSTSKDLRFALHDLELAARLHVFGRVHAWDWARGDLAVDEARVDATNVSMTDQKTRALALAAESIRAVATSPFFSFGDPLANLHLRGALAKAKVHDSRALNAFLPEGAKFGFESDEGTADALLDFRIANHVAKGTIAARAMRMGAFGEKLHVRGDIQAEAALRRWDMSGHVVDVERATVRVSDLVGGIGDARAKDFLARAVVVDGSSPEVDLRAPSLRGADFHLGVVGAEMPDGRALGKLVPEGGLLGITSGHGYVDADIDVAASKNTARGGVVVALRKGGVRLNKTTIQGDFDAIVGVRGFDADKLAIDLSGSRVGLQDVVVRGATLDTTHWRAAAVVSRANLVLAPETQIEGDVALEADDASPLLAIVTKDDLPRFVAAAVRMENLRAKGKIIVGAHLLAVDGLDAHGDGLAIRGSYVVADDHKKGAFMAAKGPLSAGIRVGDDGAHVTLMGRDGWLARESKPVFDLQRTSEAKAKARKGE